jgi:hypothetical protein
MTAKRLLVIGLIALSLGVSLSPSAARSEDRIEKAGVAVGVTAGNLVYVPLKAISVTMGALSGALSYVLTGGNADLSRQIWRDTQEGPYIITPERAERAIGERPELMAGIGEESGVGLR